MTKETVTKIFFNDVEKNEIAAMSQLLNKLWQSSHEGHILRGGIDGCEFDFDDLTAAMVFMTFLETNKHDIIIE